MIDVLRIYSHAGKNTSRFNSSTSKDLIESTLYDKIKEDPQSFLDIVNDPNFKTRVLIDKLMVARIILRNGTRYIVNGGDQLGATLEDTINYLADPANQEVVISLRAKLTEK